jgi:2-amino-4-hydroxy-6-hydroxymethyldihydropteridine diphosphokinase
LSKKVYLALGTNIGDRLINLLKAAERLERAAHVKRSSAVYETPPWGYLDQPDFLNQVLEAETDLSPQDLIVEIKRIEADMGRRKIILNGPRLIDIDILFYEDEVVEQPNLIVPHPRLHERAFVLVPLADLAPDLVHPLRGETVRQMLEKIDLSEINVYTGEVDLRE